MMGFFNIVLAKYKKIGTVVPIFLWLPGRDSNPRMTGPKPAALPLGYRAMVRVLFLKGSHIIA